MADNSRIEELRRRVQMDPASIAFAALAEEYRRNGRYEDAIATCQAGLQRHPAYLSARVTLGRALLEMGRYEDARDELEHVLRLAPENLAAIRGLAEIHARRREAPALEDDFPSEATAAGPIEPAPPAPEPTAAPDASRPTQLSVAGPSPDAAALPALETFLSAIVRAQRPQRPPSTASANDH
jgi:tetratricopeptide (TPR) repeat protein